MRTLPIQRPITLNTVMGVLNRLIGDQRKLYQARAAEDYFFKDLESHIRFEDRPNAISEEIVYLRNLKGSLDQESFSGMIKSDDPLLCSAYSEQLWGILALDISQLIEFIEKRTAPLLAIPLDPLSLSARLKEIDKSKLPKMDYTNTLCILQKAFSEYEAMESTTLKPLNLYAAALYLQVEVLQTQFDLSAGLTKLGGLPGISKKGFTLKDFMKRFTTGKGKIIFGNPYLKKEKIKGEGEVVSKLKKASGRLVIFLDVPEEVAYPLADAIEAAGVSSFYLGKKGLAYVTHCEV